MSRRIVATVSKSGCNFSFGKKKISQANINFVFRTKIIVTMKYMQFSHVFLVNI